MTIAACLVAILAIGTGISASSVGADSSKSLSGVQMIVAMPGTGQSFDAGIQQTLVKDFEKKTGATVTIENTSTLPSTLAAQEQAGNVSIDVILYATTGDYLLAQKQGYLQKLNTKHVPLNKLNPKTVTPYGIQAWAYASVMAWNTKSLKGKHPSAIEDIMNTSKYPGKRCLYKYPEYGGTLEAPLIASGVPANKVYPLKVNRALNELGKLKGNVIWWSTGAQAEQNLANGSCSMALYYSGDIYTMAKIHHEPVKLAWGHAVVEVPVLAIPKGAPHLQASEAFLKSLITDLAGQKALLKQLPYTTVTLKAGLNSILPNKGIAKWLPAGANLKTAVYANDTYYSKHIDALVKKFNSWLLTQ